MQGKALPQRKQLMVAKRKTPALLVQMLWDLPGAALEGCVLRVVAGGHG